MGTARDTAYAAIDVGTTKIATLVAKVASNGTMEVVAMGHATSQGMRKGLVVSPSELTDAIRRSVADAEGMYGRKLPPVLVGITGGHLTCINAAADLAPNGSSGPRAFSQYDVDRLLNDTLKQSDRKRRVVHVVPRTYQVDGLSGVRNPIGMKGERLSAESHIVVGDSATMDNLERVVRAAGVKVQGLVIEHLASAEAVLTLDERDAGVVLVDIGGGTADIAIYRDGALFYTAAVLIAGNHFTNDIAVGLGLQPASAEKVKIQHGSATIDFVDPRATVDVPTGLGDHKRQISQLTLNQLIRDRAIEMVRMILAKVAESGLRKVPPGGIVLTGGTAELGGLAEIVADYGKCTVRVGSPSANLGLPAELERSTFATGVGLILWSIQHKHPGGVALSVTVSDSVLGRLKGWLGKFASRGPVTPSGATGVRA